MIRRLVHWALSFAVAAVLASSGAGEERTPMALAPRGGETGRLGVYVGTYTGG